MTQSSPPTCSWRPGDSEALRIALSIPVTSAALAALNREMAQLQTHYPTGVCTAQGHLDSIAALNEQLAALNPAEVNSPVRSRRKGVAGGVVLISHLVVRPAVEERGTQRPQEEFGHGSARLPVRLSAGAAGHSTRSGRLACRGSGWPDPVWGGCSRPG